MGIERQSRRIDLSGQHEGRTLRDLFQSACEDFSNSLQSLREDYLLQERLWIAQLPQIFLRPSNEQGGKFIQALTDELKQVSETLVRSGVIQETHWNSIGEEHTIEQLEESRKGILCELIASRIEFLRRFTRDSDSFGQLVNLVNASLWDKKIEILDSGSLGFAGEKGVLNELSSGEMHLIMIYMEALFTNESTRILAIDEPELSLHPEWIDDLTWNLRDIARNRNLQVILATHSPSVVGEYSGQLATVEAVV